MAKPIKQNTEELQALLEYANSLPAALDTSDATATADDIVAGEIAYVNGIKITGVNPYDKATTDAEVESQAAQIAEIVELLDSKGAPSVAPAVETCTVTLIGKTAFSCLAATLVDGATEYGLHTISGTVTMDNCVKNSPLVTNLSMVSVEGDTIPGQNIGTCVVYMITGDCTLTHNVCFARDTKILLADGTTKFVQDIVYDDLLLVWDFDNGCYSTAYPLWIKMEQATSSYYRCTFDNGAVLNLVGSNGRCHRVFSLDRNMFESATECVGEHIMTYDGVATMLSCERIDDATDFYNVITERHINLFAEGVLTSCRLNNIYPIADMKFVKDDRNIIPYEHFNDVNADLYNGLRLGEQPMSTEALAIYVSRLNKLKKEA